MITSDPISELLTDWTLAVTHADITKVQTLLKVEPELLWTPIPHPQDDNLEKRLVQLEYLGSQFQPLCAVHISILYFNNHKNFNFTSYLIKESTLHDLDTRFWGECNNTTLHLACFLGNQPMVDLLLERGVSTLSVNHLGYSPQDANPQIQLKRIKHPNSDRFKLLKEAAKSSDEKHIMGSLNKKTSEHQYFRKGKVKETQKKVLTEEEEQMIEGQKKRQLEVAQLVKRSAVKNNPLYQKLEKVSTTKRSRASPLKENIYDVFEKNNSLKATIPKKHINIVKLDKTAFSDQKNSHIAPISPNVQQQPENLDQLQANEKSPIATVQNTLDHVKHVDSLAVSEKPVDSVHKVQNENPSNLDSHKKYLDENYSEKQDNVQEKINAQAEIQKESVHNISEDCSQEKLVDQNIIPVEIQDVDNTLVEKKVFSVDDTPIETQKEPENCTLPEIKDESVDQNCTPPGIKDESIDQNCTPPGIKDESIDQNCTPPGIKDESVDQNCTPPRIKDESVDQKYTLVEEKIIDQDYVQTEIEDEYVNKIHAPAEKQDGDVNYAQENIAHDDHDIVEKYTQVETEEQNFENIFEAKEPESSLQTVDDYLAFPKEIDSDILKDTHVPESSNLDTFNKCDSDGYETFTQVHFEKDIHINKKSAVDELPGKKVSFEEFDKVESEDDSSAEEDNTFYESLDESDNQNLTQKTTESSKDDDTSSVLSTTDEDDEYEDDNLQPVTRTLETAYNPTDLTKDSLKEESYDINPSSTATLTNDSNHFSKLSDDSGVDIEEEEERVKKVAYVCNKSKMSDRDMKRRSGSQKAAWSMSMSSWAAILDREFNLSDLNPEMANKEQKKANREKANGNRPESIIQAQRNNSTVSTLTNNSTLSALASNSTMFASSSSMDVSTQAIKSNTDISMLGSTSSMDVSTRGIKSITDVTMLDSSSSMDVSMLNNNSNMNITFLGGNSDTTMLGSSLELPESKIEVSDVNESKIEISETDLSKLKLSEMDLSRMEVSQLDLSCSNPNTSKPDNTIPVKTDKPFIPKTSPKKSRKPLPAIAVTAPKPDDSNPQNHHTNIEPILTPNIYYNSSYGKLYLHVNCIQDILLPLPKDCAFVRCVVSDGRFEYMSRYEVLDQSINFNYECVIDAHPDMIITISLHVRPDFIMKSRKPFSRLFSSRKKKECLSGYVNKDDGAIGQSRFALAHMVPVCNEITYEAGFSCFNAWYSKSFKERHRQKKKDQDVLKVVGNFNVEMLYLSQSSLQPYPKTLAGYNCHSSSH